MSLVSELRDALVKERRWYLVALRAAESDLRTISPEPASLEQVRVRIAASEADIGQSA